MAKPLAGRGYLEQRESGRIVSVTTIIAVAVKTEGKREILGLHIGPSAASQPASWERSHRA